MSSTLRTLTPATYISIRASSTEDSRRRYRSIMAVSKGRLRSFGTVGVTSPTLVSRCRSWLPARVPLRPSVRSYFRAPQSSSALGIQQRVQRIVHREPNYLVQVRLDGPFIDLNYRSQRLPGSSFRISSRFSGWLHLRSEVSLLLRVPASNNQIKYAKNSLRYRRPHASPAN